jgi:D-threo-aldose 1-dehydrogenase
MNPNEKAGIGKQGLEVTRMGVGGTGFGNLYRPTSDTDSKATIEAAYEAGIRYFDTAPLYGLGLSEKRVGEGLSAYDRDEVVISSKVGRLLLPRDPDEPFVGIYTEVPELKPIFDFSRDGVRSSIEQSLERLKTDRLDIVLVHDPDESVTNQPGADPYSKSHFDEVMNETYPALDELRSKGTVKAIGLGMNQWQMLRDFANAGDWDCFLLAGRYTLLEQDALLELLPLCVEKGVRIIVGGPYNSGILATGAVEGATYNYSEASPETLERVRTIEGLCARHSVPLQAAALQFPLAHPAIATIIPGARSAKELTSNVGFLKTVIPPGFWEELQDTGLVDAEAPLPS